MYIFEPPTITAAAAPAVPNILYLNNCKPGGCTVVSGAHDSRTNRSSIVSGQRLLAPLSHRDEVWDAVVSCVRAAYAPFAIKIVTEDPGMVPHFEAMVAGLPTNLAFPSVINGVAPFTCDVIPNAISFTFGNLLHTVDELCWVTLQESAHVFGLEHSMLATDAMTYTLVPPKKGFIDEEACIGEYACCVGSVCGCGRTMMNSHERLAAVLGLDPDAPAVSIVSPADRALVPTEFSVEADVTGMTDVVAVEVRVDTELVARLTTPPYVYTTDPMLRLGVHTISVRAEGFYGSSVTSPTISVVRGSPPGDPEPEPEPRAEDGGCAVTRDADAVFVALVLGVGMWVRRRRRTASSTAGR